MTFPARHPGTCVECGTRYHVGDPIAPPIGLPEADQ